MIENRREKLKNIIVKSIQKTTSYGESITIADDENLISSGILNSIGMLNIVVDLDAQAGCNIPPAEINKNNFETIDKIIQLAEKFAVSEAIV